MMIQVHPIYDFLDLMSVYIQDIQINKNQIQLQLNDLKISGGYAGHERDTQLEHCLLVLKGVVFSNRILVYYTDSNHRNLGKSENILDGPFEPLGGNLFLFYIEGISKTQNAYVTWNIIAENLDILPINL